MRTLTNAFFFALMTTLVGCGSVVIRAEPETDGGVATDQPVATDRPIVVDRPPPVDVPRSCTSNAECGAGMECVGGGEGCSVPWTCQPANTRACTADYSPFCGCDGTTFYGSSSCPLRPFAHRGVCETTPPVDAGPSGCLMPDGTVCIVGTVCSVGECDSCFCAAPGELRCTGGGCVDAGPPPNLCHGNVDCAAGTICVGAQGCGIPWTCQPAPPCTHDLATYCSCDGTTFMASSTCPGRPYVYRGACGIIPPTPDAGPGFCTISGVSCPVGVPCRIDACTTCVCEGDAVSCGVSPDCASDGGIMDGGIVPPPLCPAQDVHGVGLCDLFLGYAWNGANCVLVGGCSCGGSDCASLRPTLAQCDADHRACPRPL